MARADDNLESSDAERILRAVKVAAILAGILPLVRAAVIAFGKDAVASAGSTVAFDTSHPFVQSFIAQYSSNEAAAVNSTTLRQLRAHLAEAVKTAENLAKTEARIKKVFDQGKGPRARTIARTETTASATAGSSEGMRQAGLNEKLWLSQRDVVVRDTHLPGIGLDGQHVPLDADFFSWMTGATGPGPGLMNLAEESINCRCFIVPYLVASPPRSEHFLTRLWRFKESIAAPIERAGVRSVQRAFARQQRDALAALREPLMLEN